MDRKARPCCWKNPGSERFEQPHWGGRIALEKVLPIVTIKVIIAIEKWCSHLIPPVGCETSALEDFTRNCANLPNWNHYSIKEFFAVKDLKQNVAIITGSSSGVGAATARLLASLGCNVVINYNSNAEGAEQVAADCRQLGAETLVLGGNVAKDADCHALVDAAMAKWGRLDVLVNNAGTTKFVDHSDLDGLDSDDFQRIYGVNVIGCYQMVRAANAVMQQQAGGGVVVNVASTAAITGIGSSIAYAASKGAMVTLTLSLARALGPKLRINAVCPGFIEGDWLLEGLGQQKYEELIQFNRKNAPLGVTATPDTVAEAILYFITGPQVVTGETMIVDGGRHLTMTPLTRR